MFKYIRTKDGRIIFQGDPNDKGFEKGTFEIHNFGNKETLAPINNDDILKEADTIEELCDMFVCVYNNDNNHDIYYPYVIDVKDMNLTKNNNWYGAIWIKWGLKYVAKLNDKGELELI